MNSLKKIADTELGSNKKKIITTFFYNQNSTIAELAKELNLSIPTVTKLVNEMVEEGILNDYGKSDSKSGRKPSTYGLNPQSGYFLGIDIKRDVVNIGLSNFNGEIVRQDFDVTYNIQQSQDAIIDDICRLTLDFIASSGVDKNKILNACANITGRVNPTSGYSYSFFVYPETPLTEVLSEKLGVPVCIENDTRAMAYGEMLRGNVNGEKNMLFVNVSWGLGLGIILDGRVYEGKSGFAGEFGHIHAFDNEIMCHCGKKGCLETEVSGSALHRRVIESIREGKVSVLSQQFENLDDITLGDIIDAVNAEDYLCIDILEEIGLKLGKHLANMINIFNPEVVVVGGSLSLAGDYLLQPVRQAIKKHSLKLVNSDTRLVCSKLHEKAGVIGSCMTARRQMFENANV